MNTKKLKQPLKAPKKHASQNSFGSVFFIFLRLGLTSFGGPIAHIAYFREAFVLRRKWFSEKEYADLVALCQFLPGPASSQVGFAIGWQRAGYFGGLAAWLGFTLPSAVILMLFALGMTQGYNLPNGVVHGLKIVAVAVVAHAVWGMANQLCQGAVKMTLAIMAACVVLLVEVAWIQLLVIALGGVAGKVLFREHDEESRQLQSMPNQQSMFHLLSSDGTKLLLLFFALLFCLPLLTKVYYSPTLSLFDGFYRAGALVFGGGHVVLPLLQAEVVSNGLVTAQDFLTGYGLAQAVPGPMFTFAAFLGTVATEGGGIIGGTVALIAIFTPALLLVPAILPVWGQLRKIPTFQSVLSGVNVSVVGLLLAALYQPIWLSTVSDVSDFVLVLLALSALMLWKLPVWVVVFGCAVAGGLFY